MTMETTHKEKWACWHLRIVKTLGGQITPYERKQIWEMIGYGWTEKLIVEMLQVGRLPKKKVA
jgi:hypothetical protein